MENGEPAEGIFLLSFQPHSNEKGSYYSLKFDWRLRKPEELDQLRLIAEFMQGNPVLMDSIATRDMICIESASVELVEQIKLAAHDLPALESA
jgi:hypothetical protein